eukprot:TRINITY_DN2571_c0_g1_i2.p1 TRINITY_DN2571_c0_g1~~TRINITY_DN2571_c0_g1_i2.p1  ORF type:complete len:169 (+),score=17.29 TRINITY_DN2571_c0_g1_i2:151-657(+)
MQVKVLQLQRTMDVANKLARGTKHKREMEHHFAKHRRTIAGLVQGKQSRELLAVRTADGRLSTNLGEIDRAFREAWSPVFQMYKDRPEPATEEFVKFFGGYIPHCSMTTTELTFAQLQKVLHKKQRQHCAGVDGWRLSELAHQPPELLMVSCSSLTGSRRPACGHRPS